MRETTEKGDRLTDVIEHGISRIKHASDCLAVLLKELKEHAKGGGCRVFCAVDLVNAFYRPTNLRREDLTGIQVDHFTIGRAFKKLFRNDWVCLADWRLVPSSSLLRLTSSVSCRRMVLWSLLLERNPISGSTRRQTSGFGRESPLIPSTSWRKRFVPFCPLSLESQHQPPFLLIL